MHRWPGWSTDRQQVEQTRVLFALLSSADPAGKTTKSIDDVLAELGSDQDAGQLIRQWVTRLRLFEDELSIASSSEPLQLTSEGAAVAAKFRESSGQLPRSRGARRALLLWRHEHHGVEWLDPCNMLLDPRCWFYGSRFSPDEIWRAAKNLTDRQFMFMTGKPTAYVVQLTGKGVTCAEDYDGDPSEMERPQMTGSNYTFNNHGTIGNAAAGPVRSQQATVTVINGQTAADLLAILQVVGALGWMPSEYADEAQAVRADLQAAAAGETDPAPAIGRTQRLFHAAGSFANTNPAAVALLTAVGNLVAIKVGLPTS